MYTNTESLPQSVFRIEADRKSPVREEEIVKKTFGYQL